MVGEERGPRDFSLYMRALSAFFSGTEGSEPKWVIIRFILHFFSGASE